MNIICLKNGAITSIYTDYWVNKPCSTCTYGMTTIHELTIEFNKKLYTFRKEYEYDLTDYCANNEYGANFIDVMTFFGKDFSNMTIEDFVDAIYKEIGFKLEGFKLEGKFK